MFCFFVVVVVVVCLFVCFWGECSRGSKTSGKQKMRCYENRTFIEYLKLKSASLPFSPRKKNTPAPGKLDG